MKNYFFKTVVFLALIAGGCQTEAVSTTEKTITSAPTTGISYVDESAFISSLHTQTFLNPTNISLNRIASTTNYNKVYGFNIPEKNQVMGFKWNTGDQNTTDWRPQGITGFTWNQQRFLLTTWYGIGPSNIAGVQNQHKGVRISLVNITDPNAITYRHILLVQDKNNISNTSLFKASNSYDQLDLFAPVTIHAGGVAYANQKIYVASTSLGLRVFDLNNIIAVTADASKNKIGKDINGDLKAFNYRFILPQSGYYNILDGDPFSCVSLGENTIGNNMLYTSQYKTSSSSVIPSVYGFKLTNSGEIDPYISPEICVPKDNATGNNGPLYNIQGVYRKDNTNIFAVTGKSNYKGSTARLVLYKDGDASGKRYRWPHGAEDLYFEKSTGLLWNLTEYETSKYGEENRTVFAVHYSDYN